MLLEKRNGNVITPGRRVTGAAEEHCKQSVITSSHLELANYGRPQAWIRGGPAAWTRGGRRHSQEGARDLTSPGKCSSL